MTSLNNLSLAKKAEILLQHGKQLTSIKENGLINSLYLLDGEFDFKYAELIMGRNSMLDIKGLGNDQLDKYMHSVDPKKLRSLLH